MKYTHCLHCGKELEENHSMLLYRMDMGVKTYIGRIHEHCYDGYYGNIEKEKNLVGNIVAGLLVGFLIIIVISII